VLNLISGQNLKRCSVDSWIWMDEEKGWFRVRL